MKSSKTSFLGPRFAGRLDTPDFGHAFSNRTHFRACGQFWLSSVQRARTVADEKKKEESVVNISPSTTMLGGLINVFESGNLQRMEINWAQAYAAAQQARMASEWHTKMFVNAQCVHNLHIDAGSIKINVKVFKMLAWCPVQSYWQNALPMAIKCSSGASRLITVL